MSQQRFLFSPIFNNAINWLTDRSLIAIEENVNLGTEGVRPFVFLGQSRSRGRIPCSMNRPLHLQIDLGFAAFEDSPQLAAGNALAFAVQR